MNQDEWRYVSHFEVDVQPDGTWVLIVVYDNGVSARFYAGSRSQFEDLMAQIQRGFGRSQRRRH